MIYITTRINPRHINRIKSDDSILYYFSRPGDDFRLINKLENIEIHYLGEISLHFSLRNLFITYKKINRLELPQKPIYVFEIFTFLALSNNLLKQVKIFEIGDLLHLGRFYSGIVDILIKMRISKNNILTRVTSLGFEHYLRKKNIINTEIQVLENIPRVKKLPDVKKSKSNKKIILGYIGIFRYVDEFNYTYSLFPDKTVAVKLFGKGRSQFTGTYPYMGHFLKDELPQIYDSIDVVFCYYSGENEKLLCPNKLFEAILYCKPIIYWEKNYYSEIVEKEGIGICLNGNKHHDHILIKNLIKNYKQYQNNVIEYREIIKEKFLL